MRDTASVQSIFNVLLNKTLKRDALLFDKMVIISSNLGRMERWFPHDFATVHNELDWLAEQGLVQVIPYIQTADEFIESIDIAFFESLRTQKVTDESFVRSAIRLDLDFYCRMHAIDMRLKQGVEAIAHVELPEHLFKKGSVPTSDLLAMTVGFLPRPDEQTSWQQILDYRSDPDSQAKYLDLRNWMNETVTANLSPTEAEEKLEYLVSQFERHMALHKLKTKRSILETVIVSAAEIAEDLVKFKWGKLAKSLFAIGRKKAELLEAELTAPGSAVAYIWKSREVFK
jgi:hypothetical protein